MYLFCVLEVGTVNAGGRNTHWVYGADVGRVSGSEKCSHPTQAVTSFRTLLVVAVTHGHGNGEDLNAGGGIIDFE